MGAYAMGIYYAMEIILYRSLRGYGDRGSDLKYVLEINLVRKWIGFAGRDWRDVIPILVCNRHYLYCRSLQRGYNGFDHFGPFLDQISGSPVRMNSLLTIFSPW